MAASLRNLVSGSGTVSMTTGARTLTFSSAQSFKEGATVSCANGQKFTIDTGAGTDWTALQAATATASGQSFYASNATASRARGSTGADAPPIIPGAPHFVYVSTVDSSGNADWYFYVDTLFPENGLHPYTLDPYAPPPWAAAKSTATLALIPDLPTRVRILEGMARGSLGEIGNPDKRLDTIESRLAALEGFVGGNWYFGGDGYYWSSPLGGPPSFNYDQSGPYTISQLLSQGDGAPA